jgi:hypothetical protein
VFRIPAGFSRQHLLLGCALVGAASSCAQSPRDQTRLQLTEISALRLPPAFIPAGASIAASGALLYWNAGGVFVTGGHAGDVLAFCEPRSTHVVAAAFVSADSIVELIDASGPSLVHISLSGTCSQQTIGDSGVQVIAGSFEGGRWTVLFRHGPAGAEMMRIRFGESPKKLFDFLHSSRTPFDLEAAYVTANSIGTLHASMSWPFEWATLDTTGIITRASRAVEQDAKPSSDTTLVGWVGLPVLPIDDGFLQTLADPRSDHRVLVRYDQNGHIVRKAEMNVAFGILSTSPSQRLLLALRRSDRNEIVVYRWDWGRDSPN